MVSAALAPRAEGLIIARCSVCHSPDLIAQQRLSRDRWRVTVEKMQHWGAQISPTKPTCSSDICRHDITRGLRICCRRSTVK